MPRAAHTTFHSAKMFSHTCLVFRKHEVSKAFDNGLVDKAKLRCDCNSKLYGTDFLECTGCQRNIHKYCAAQVGSEDVTEFSQEQFAGIMMIVDAPRCSHIDIVGPAVETAQKNCYICWQRGGEMDLCYGCCRPMHPKCLRDAIEARRMEEPEDMAMAKQARKERRDARFREVQLRDMTSRVAEGRVPVKGRGRAGRVKKNNKNAALEMLACPNSSVVVCAK